MKGASWNEGSIVKVLGTRHYIVNIGENSIKRHIDQIIECNSTINVQCDLNDEISVPKPIQIASSTATDVPMPSNSASIIQPIPKSLVSSVLSPTATKFLSPPTVSDTVGLRISSRITKPSTRYNAYVK